MKSGSGIVPVYSSYDEDGTLDAKGTSLQLSERYFVNQNDIAKCARGERKKLLKRYTIVRETDEVRPEITERMTIIRRLHNQGANTAEISRQTNLSEGTVRRYIREMKARGEIV